MINFQGERMSQRKQESNKVQRIASFKIEGSYPRINRIELSFPASNRFDNVIVNQWFGGRVCVQHVGQNIELYLLVAMDKHERMPIIEVLKILEHKGLALTQDALVDLQSAYFEFKKAPKNNDTKTTIEKVILQSYKGLEKLFPDNSWYLKTGTITEDDIKNAVPVEERFFFLDLDEDGISSVEKKSNLKLNNTERKSMNANEQEVFNQELREFDLKQKIIKSLKERIGEEAYFQLTIDSHHETYKRQIDAWINHRFASLKTVNPEAVDAELENSNDSSVQHLLLRLTDDAIFYHKSNKNVNDFTLLLLMQINKKYRFVKENNVGLLCEAIKTKNLWCLFQILDFGIDVNSPLLRSVDPNSEAHNTDIFKAYYYKRLDLLKEKLDAGGDPNQTNEKGETLLQLARKDKNNACIELLVSYYSPLFLAYELNEPLMIEMLLSAGADKDQVGPEGLTLLQLAERDSKKDISQLLSEFSSKKEGSVAVVEDKLEKLREFTSQYYLGDVTIDELNALSIEHHYYEKTINFWMSGKDLRSPDAFLQDLLNIACDLKDSRNFVWLTTRLIKRESNLSRGDYEKITERKQNEVKDLGPEMEQLFELFSDPDQFYTELSWKNVKFYTLANQWLNDSNNTNYTAIKLFNLLLKISVQLPDDKAFRILIDTHKKNNFIDLSDPYATLDLAIRTQNIELLSELIEIGFNLNKVDRQSTPLAIACSTGNLDIVKLLIQKGADPNLLVDKNRTFEFIAMTHEYKKEIVDFIKPLIKAETISKKEKDSEKLQKSGEKDKKAESSSSRSTSSESDTSNDSSSEEQEQLTPAQKTVRLIFNNLRESQDLEKFIAKQWTAYRSRDNKVTKKDFAKNLDFVNAKIKGLDDELRFDKFTHRDEAKELETDHVNRVRARFQNMLVYGAKLYREHEECEDAKKKEVLASKVDALSKFINTIGDLPNLADNEEAIRKACNALEQQDANRGTGFYRVHTFFTKKRYEDEKGRSRLVKSTMGELAYDFYMAVKGLSEVVKKEALKEDMREEVVENSVVVGQ